MDNTKLIEEARAWAIEQLPEGPWAEKHVVHRLAAALEAAEAEAQRGLEMWSAEVTRGDLATIRAVQAEAELTRRETVQALHEEGDRVVLSSAIGAVVWNASNHPKPSAVLGRDIGPLRSKLVDAVIAAGFTRAAPVSLEAVKAETATEWRRAAPGRHYPAVFDEAPELNEGEHHLTREVTEWRPVEAEKGGAQNE